MRICVICHFETVPDDVALAFGTGVICLRCYERETGSGLEMSPEPRRSLSTALAPLEGK